MQRKTKLIITIAVIAVLLGLLLRVLASIFTQQASTTPNFNDSHTNFSRVSYIGTPPDLPTTATVFDVKTSNPPLEEFVNDLMAKVPFERNPYTDFIYHSKEGTLQILKDQHEIVYTVNQVLGESEEDAPPTDMQESTAVTAALSFLQDIFGLSTTELHLTEVKYFLDHEASPQVGSTYARFAQLSFDQKLDNIVVGTSFVGEELVRVTVDNEYSVIATTFTPLKIESTPIRTHPLLSVSEAVQNINNNKAFVANASWMTAKELTLEQVAQAELNAVRLEYFSPTAGSQRLVPYYRFYGTAKDAQGREMLVEIMTPAVDTNKPVEE